MVDRTRTAVRLQELRFKNFNDTLQRAELAAESENQAKKASIDRLYEKFLKRMFDESALNERNGDEEMAFIFINRYCLLAQMLGKRPDVKTWPQKQKFLAQYKTALDIVNRLQSSLQRRYELHAEEVALRLAEPTSESSTTTDTDNRNSSATDLILPSENDPANPAVIAPLNLFHLLKSQNLPNGVLLLDFRPVEEMEMLLNLEPSSFSAHVTSISIPSRVLNHGCTAKKVCDSLDVATRSAFVRALEECDLTILIDSCGQQTDLIGSSANILLNAITTYKTGKRAKRPPMILEGGFANWALHYQMLTKLNEEFKRNLDIDQEEQTLDQFLLDIPHIQVEYPNLDDLVEERFPIKQRDRSPEKDDAEMVTPPPTVPTPQPSVRPVIDRSLKPSLLIPSASIPVSPVVSSSDTDLMVPTSTNVLPAAENGDGGSTMAIPTVSRLPPTFDRRTKPRDIVGGGDGDSFTPDAAIQQRFDNAVSRQIDNSERLLEIRKNLDGAKLSFDGNSDTLNNDVSGTNKQSDSSHSFHNPKPTDNGVSAPNSQTHRTTDKSNTSLPTKPTTPNVPDRTQKPTTDNNSNVQHVTEQMHKINNSMWQLSTHGRRHPGLTGLHNLGNTCFLNSIIQSLSSCKPLRELFTSDDYIRRINNRNRLGTKGYVAINFACVLKALWRGDFEALNLSYFLTVLRVQVKAMFANGRQHDAQELMVTLLESLHEDLNKVHHRVYVEQQNEGKSLVVAGREAWRNAEQFSSSPVHEMFQGQLISVVSCGTCREQSVTFDIFTQVTLELPVDGSSLTIHDCLREHFRSEVMRGDARWMCPRCRTLRDATKQMWLWRLPQQLVIHLKRFERGSYDYKKIDRKVDFPIRGLDLRRYLHPESDQRHLGYHLFAVTNHRGDLASGHYTAVCRWQQDERWYRFDDDRVSSAHESGLQSSLAYILFYTSAPWW